MLFAFPRRLLVPGRDHYDRAFSVPMPGFCLQLQRRPADGNKLFVRPEDALATHHRMKNSCIADRCRAAHYIGCCAGNDRRCALHGSGKGDDQGSGKHEAAHGRLLKFVPAQDRCPSGKDRDALLHVVSGNVNVELRNSTQLKSVVR